MKVCNTFNNALKTSAISQFIAAHGDIIGLAIHLLTSARSTIKHTPLFMDLFLFCLKRYVGIVCKIQLSARICNLENKTSINHTGFAKCLHKIIANNSVL